MLHFCFENSLNRGKYSRSKQKKLMLHYAEFSPDFIAFILLQLQKTHLNYETSLAWILYIDETELTFSGEPECY